LVKVLLQYKPDLRAKDSEGKTPAQLAEDGPIKDCLLRAVDEESSILSEELQSLLNVLERNPQLMAEFRRATSEMTRSSAAVDDGQPEAIAQEDAGEGEGTLKLNT